MRPVLPSRSLIIGIGNLHRGDDAAGLLVARRLREWLPAEVAVVENSGDLVALLDQWDGWPRVFVIDAMRSGAPAGSIRRFDAHPGPLDFETTTTSSHALGLAQAIELARTLDRLPPRIVIYGIEAECADFDAPLTPAVQSAIDEVAKRIVAEMRDV